MKLDPELYKKLSTDLDNIRGFVDDLEDYLDDAEEPEEGQDFVPNAFLNLIKAIEARLDAMKKRIYHPNIELDVDKKE